MSDRGDQRWLTAGHLMLDVASRVPGRIAIVDTDRQLSYAQLRDEVLECAAAIINAGVVRGDRVAIWAPNGWPWIVAALGAQISGAAVIPINTRFRGPEAAELIERTAPRIVVVTDRFLETDYVAMLEAHECLTRERVTVRLGDANDPSPRVTEWPAFLAAGSRVSARTVRDRLRSLQGDDVSDIMFTSGTTGHPKGVIATHAQNLRAFLDWGTLAGMRLGDRYAVINPFFHTFGFKAGWLSALMFEMTVYPHATFEPDRLATQICEERITFLPGPPTLFDSLLARSDAEQRAMSSLRLAIVGATSIPPGLIHRLRDELGFERVTTCYGLTEATGIVTISRDDDPPDTVATTAGRPLPDVEVRLTAPDGVEVAAGAKGEVWVRGYNVMRGYLDDPETTAERIDGDGWLHTGDVATIDQAGNLTITDRLVDMFVVGGFNAYPAEIERVLSSHPAIADVAVIGVPDQRLGEVGVAFIVPAVTSRLDPEAVISWARERMANYKVPRRVVFLRALPRNATGKVVKGHLRARRESPLSGEP